MTGLGKTVGYQFFWSTLASITITTDLVRETNRSVARDFLISVLFYYCVSKLSYARTFPPSKRIKKQKTCTSGSNIIIQKYKYISALVCKYN